VLKVATRPVFSMSTEEVFAWIFSRFSAWIVAGLFMLAAFSYVLRGWLLGRQTAYGVAVALAFVGGFYAWIAINPESPLEVRGGMVRISLGILCFSLLVANRIDVGVALKELWHRNNRGH